ncbi:MAG: RNA-binding protein [candidate division Zixibacteria bacterium]|nr:RNA-binding protein [candidate division Zixibacteria bacterium]MDH3938508.1 RNA-binding protein [candidate division Zixibacteria bacterium]MDH4032865.1 RNA-binding protein [candidate division Zixibacteria bacterium]
MKIYVGNLAHETTEPQLRESFEAFGTVDSTSIVMDKDSGKSKGFAFVEMSSDDHAQKAITGLHGKDLAGNPLKVNAARDNSSSSN